MKNASKILTAAAAAALLAAVFCGCSSGKKSTYIIPDDMPEICRGINFDEDPDMMDLCGVRTKVFKSKQTEEIARPLIQPKGALLARYKNETELRVPAFNPVKIPEKFIGDVSFEEKDRMKKIANRMEYIELGKASDKRYFRLSLPQEYGEWRDICFQVRDKDLRPVSCKSFKRKASRAS